MVDCGEYIGVCGDEEGDDTESEGCVEAGEADDGLCEQHTERSGDGGGYEEADVLKCGALAC